MTVTVSDIAQLASAVRAAEDGFATPSAASVAATVTDTSTVERIVSDATAASLVHATDGQINTNVGNFHNCLYLPELRLNMLT